MQFRRSMRRPVAFACFDLRAAFLHLLAHGVQVVGLGDDGEQQDQRATQREQANDGTPAPGALRVLSPPQNRGQRQQEPTNVEEQFHALRVSDLITQHAPRRHAMLLANSNVAICPMHTPWGIRPGDSLSIVFAPGEL